MQGELNSQSTLLLSDALDKNWVWFPKILKKSDGTSLVDYSKSTKPHQYIKVVDIKLKSENEVFEEIKDFYDNSLESENDDRLFRIIIDISGLLSHRLLLNMMALSRKTTISFMVVNDISKSTDIMDYYCYFDKIFEVSGINMNIKHTSGTIKVKKWKEFDSIINPHIRNVGPEKIMFWGFEKNSYLSFRDIDLTEII